MSLRARAMLVMLLCSSFGLSIIFRSMFMHKKPFARSSVKLRMQTRLQKQLRLHRLLNLTDVYSSNSSSMSLLQLHTYTVRPNDTLSPIATRLSVPVAAILDTNGLLDAHHIDVRPQLSCLPHVLAGRTSVENS